MKTSGRKHQEKRKQTFSNVVEIERKFIGYILWRQKYDVVVQILNQKVHVKYCLKRQVFKSNFKLQSFFIACITPVILFIWDLIRSVNIPGHVALLLFVGLVSETAPPVSPRDSQNIGFSLQERRQFQIFSVFFLAGQSSWRENPILSESWGDDWRTI